MSREDNLPPNPREARRRYAPMHWSAYPVTMLLIIACVIVAVVSKLGNDTGKISSLFFATPYSKNQQIDVWEQTVKDQLQRGDKMEFNRAEAEKEFERRLKFGEIQHGQVWRLFTPMLIHFGPWHLLFNMMWLWDFGRMLESRFRPLRFLLLVLGISLVANVAEVLVSHPLFGGMSGVNYGLFGFIFIRQKFHPAGDVSLNPQAVPMLLIWLVVCFTGALGPIANGAHVAGLIVGGLIGWVNAMLGGGWEQIQRRRKFQSAISRSQTELHRCAVCQRTERDDPNLDFRVGEDGEEYCTEHLPEKRPVS